MDLYLLHDAFERWLNGHIYLVLEGNNFLSLLCTLYNSGYSCNFIEIL